VSQAAFGLVGASYSAPTILTGAGAAGFAVSADQFVAGLRTAWSGERARTATAMVSTSVAGALGADRETASDLGTSADLLLGLGSARALTNNYSSLRTLSQSRAVEVRDVVDTFAPRLNPLNYQLPRGLFSGVPVPEYIAPQGGTYMLVTRNSGMVVRTGRTGNLLAREQQHMRQFENTLHFEKAIQSNSYAVQRGSEQVLHELYRPILNKINPISPSNPLREYYLRAYRQFIGGQQ